MERLRTSLAGRRLVVRTHSPRACWHSEPAKRSPSLIWRATRGSPGSDRRRSPRAWARCSPSRCGTGPRVSVRWTCTGTPRARSPIRPARPARPLRTSPRPTSSTRRLVGRPAGRRLVPRTGAARRAHGAAEPRAAAGADRARFGPEQAYAPRGAPPASVQAVRAGSTARRPIAAPLRRRSLLVGPRDRSARSSRPRLSRAVAGGTR